MIDQDYQQIKRDLIVAYNRKANERDTKKISTWKAKERSDFLHQLTTSRKTTLLEIGTGVGVHGRFFSKNGLQVTSIDLSIENLKRCRAKGLSSVLMDFMNLGIGDQ